MPTKMVRGKEIRRAFFSLIIFVLIVIGGAGVLVQTLSSSGQNFSVVENSTLTSGTEHEVRAKVLFEGIQNIDLSRGHYDAVVEVLLTWDGDTVSFEKEFGSKTIHGNEYKNFIANIWHPEFLIANAAKPRKTFYKTLGVQRGKFELFEKFRVNLTIDANMPSYPFGVLDLYMEISSYSGSISKMILVPEKIEIGHRDSEGNGHVVVKGNWTVKKTGTVVQARNSLNHGGEEKFSYLITHVTVMHDFWDSVQQVIFPIAAIILLSMIINIFFPLNKERSLNGYWRAYGNWALFFAVPAYKFALADSVPTTHYLALIDVLFIFALLIVTSNLILSFYSNYLFMHEQTEKGNYVEKFTQRWFPLLSALLFILFLIPIIS